MQIPYGLRCCWEAHRSSGVQQVKLGRDDNGFRARGLPSLLLVSTVLAAVFQALLMLTWPLVADESVPRQGALAQYHNDPIAFGLVAVFVIAAVRVHDRRPQNMFS